MRTKTRIPSFSHYLSFISRTARRIPPLKIGYFIIDSMTFKYRRKITITEQSGNNLSDYQVRIDLDATNFDFSHAQTNGEDIRFTDESGNLLDYWIEEWDALNEKAKIWVKAPSIPANSSVEIYCYYGNSEITSASDASATFIRIIDGVVGSWHFDEGSGTTAYDTSGNDNDGALVNGPTWVDGKFGKALQFDETQDQYVEVPDDPSLDITGEITIEAWVKWNSAAAEHNIIVAKGTSNDYYNPYQFRVDRDTGVVRATTPKVIGSSAWYHIDGSVDENWHHLVWTVEGSTSRIYIDTVVDEETFDGTWTTNDEPLLIGIRGAFAPFHGIMDEVRLYNRALTAEEISDIYNNYGYTTENYPGKVLVRKYTEPEPSISIGGEESA